MRTEFLGRLELNRLASGLNISLAKIHGRLARLSSRDTELTALAVSSHHSTTDDPHFRAARLGYHIETNGNQHGSKRQRIPVHTKPTHANPNRVPVADSPERFSTGIPALDEMLGGGLIPGTLTVVLGATGIGKTQLGISFANAGTDQEGERGVIFDMTARGDSQNHDDYANRIGQWNLTRASMDDKFDVDQIWDASAARHDYAHVYSTSGRRVTVGDMTQAQRQEWESEQARKLDQTIAFFYGNFIHGVRRCVIDGVEPSDRASDSIQFDMFEYIYHQIIHKDHDWVARDLLRVKFRQNAERVESHAYDQSKLASLMLYTCHEVMLDDLITRPIESGDLLSGANTIILMGKTRDGNKMGRALAVAKHRGSACDESIVPYTIDNNGIQLS